MFVSLWICKASATAEVATNQASVIGIRRLARKSTLDYSVVVDAPWMTTFYVGIAKNSAHPNAGKLLISLVLSKEGQDILWETSRDGSHHVKGTKYHAWFQKK
jgi:ABC-type Fe3+ transport system substrate-binding protein